jgi:DNA-binding NarL/FixJ family response regulator
MEKNGHKSKVDCDALLEHAKDRIEQVEAKVEMATTIAELAESRVELAETRTELAETRAVIAEARAQQVETVLQEVLQKVSEPNGSTVVAPSTNDTNDTERVNLDHLTIRQRDILRLIAEGQNTKQIASILGVSPKTIEYHRAKLMRAVGRHDVPGLVRLAMRAGLVRSKADRS